MASSWSRWVAFALAVALLVVYYGYTASGPDSGGLYLDGIQILRYDVTEVSLYDPPIANITNSTVNGSATMMVSAWGGGYLIERLSDGLTPSGPNATFSLDSRGGVTNVEFEASRDGNSTVLFSASKGSSFDFPEVVRLPDGGKRVPQHWSIDIHFNYTMTTVPGSPASVLRQVGVSHYELEATGKTTVTTPAGTFRAIQVRYEQLLNWNQSWGTYRPKQRNLQSRTHGIMMLELKTGVLIQRSWESEVNGSLGRHRGTTALASFEPQDAIRACGVC
jgi:hypothetical protein